MFAAAGVLTAASAFGVWRRRTDGAVRAVGTAFSAGPGAGDAGSDSASAGGAAGGTVAGDRLGAADLGIDLDARATLVQFSSKVCRYCGPTRRLLREIADRHAVSYLDIDAEERLDLARRLTVLRTPTVLVLDAEGRVTHRVSGPPRRDELAAVVGKLAGSESA